VAGQDALFVADQTGGDRQGEQQDSVLAGVDGGRGQGCQPVFEVGDGLVQVTGARADISPAEGGERLRGRVVQLSGQAGALRQQPQGGAAVAADGSQETGEQQPLRPPYGRLAGPSQYLAEPVPTLADIPRVPVVIGPDVQRDPQPGLGLVKVTRREWDSSRLTSATSSRRATKLVSSAGRLPAARRTVAITNQRRATRAARQFEGIQSLSGPWELACPRCHIPKARTVFPDSGSDRPPDGAAPAAAKRSACNTRPGPPRWAGRLTCAVTPARSE
jgi:hypothetical protein